MSMRKKKTISTVERGNRARETRKQSFVKQASDHSRQEICAQNLNLRATLMTTELKTEWVGWGGQVNPDVAAQVEKLLEDMQELCNAVRPIAYPPSPHRGK